MGKRRKKGKQSYCLHQHCLNQHICAMQLNVIRIYNNTIRSDTIRYFVLFCFCFILPHISPSLFCLHRCHRISFETCIICMHKCVYSVHRKSYGEQKICNMRTSLRKICFFSHSVYLHSVSYTVCVDCVCVLVFLFIPIAVDFFRQYFFFSFLTLIQSVRYAEQKKVANCTEYVSVDWYRHRNIDTTTPVVLVQSKL